MLAVIEMIEEFKRLQAAGDPNAEKYYDTETRAFYENGELEECARAGNDEAQYAFAYYIEQEAIEQNTDPHTWPNDRKFQQAVDWYKAAAMKGHAIAIHNLALCYAEGRGVPVSLPTYARLLKKALRKRCSMALPGLGHYYFEKEDFVKAAHYLDRATAHGYADCYKWLGDCFRDGKGVKQDRMKAAECYVRAGALDEDIQEPTDERHQAREALRALAKSVEAEVTSPMRETILQIAKPLRPTATVLDFARAKIARTKLDH